VTIGVGVGFEANTGVFNISAKEMAYIEFSTDVNSGNTNVTDWGVKATDELSVGKILEPIGVKAAGIEGTVKSGYESGISQAALQKDLNRPCSTAKSISRSRR